MKKTAYCKINLTLEILGTKRGDGFHDIATVMHKIPLGDIIELDVTEGEGNITLYCDTDVCCAEDNLAYRASKMYLEAYSKNTGKNADVSIRLTKITPTGAGLGGGSADAAAVLDMLAKQLSGVSQQEVLEMAQKLGSDVPFCLERYMSAVCTGRGEKCRNISRLPKGTCLVVAKPVESINTKGIYGEYDKAYGDDYGKNKTEQAEKALESASLCDIAKSITNDFEKVCIPRLPEIQVIKDKMTMCGAVCSQMSGSGSAVFGLFDDRDKCNGCKERLLNDGYTQVYAFYDEDFEKIYTGE